MCMSVRRQKVARLFRTSAITPQTKLTLIFWWGNYGNRTTVKRLHKPSCFWKV